MRHLSARSALSCVLARGNIHVGTAAPGCPVEQSSTHCLWPLITLRQIHSDLIRCVDAVPDDPLTGDGLITATPHLLLAIQTADCLPVILVDTRRHAVGVFHAGWRGTVQRIVEKGIGEMNRCFGTRPRDLKAAIGPGFKAAATKLGKKFASGSNRSSSTAANCFERRKNRTQSAKSIPYSF